MGQNGLDQQQLFFEIDARDQSVFVSADVENQRAGGWCVIRGLERLFDCWKMRPKGRARDGHKTLQRLTGGGVVFRESCDDGLTENLHVTMFPFMGTLVKGISHTSMHRGPRPQADCSILIRWFT